MGFNFWLAVLLSVTGVWMYCMAHPISSGIGKRKPFPLSMWLARHADLSIIRAAGVLFFVPGAFRVLLTASGYFDPSPDELSLPFVKIADFYVENSLRLCGIYTIYIAFRNGPSEAESRG